MNQLLKLSVIATLLAYGALAECAVGGLVVVVNKNNPSESLSLAQLRKLMLGDVRSWPDKKPVLVVRRDSQSSRQAAMTPCHSRPPIHPPTPQRW